jgi:hypothetical protein
MNDKGDIEHVLWREELDRIIKAAFPFPLGGMALNNKGILFVDEIAKMAYRSAKQYKKNSPDVELELVFANIFKYLIDETVIHELGHALDDLTEEQARAVTRKLQRARSGGASSMSRRGRARGVGYLPTQVARSKIQGLP